MDTTLSRRSFLLRATGIAAAAFATSLPLASNSGVSSPGRLEPGSNFQVATASGNGAYLRAAPTLDGALIDLVPDGTTGRVLQGPHDADGHSWYGVEIAGTTGRMASLVMEPGGGGTGTYIQVHDGPLNVRSQPGLDHDTTGTVATWTTGRLTTEMPVEADGHIWLNAFFYDGANTHGWVAKEFITIVD